MKVIIANTFIDGISDWNITIANNFEKKIFQKLWIFFDKTISRGSPFLTVDFAVANIFTDDISDSHFVIANTLTYYEAWWEKNFARALSFR